MAENPQKESTPFHMDLHGWIESQQTAHGVRLDDYAQYHAYCTRRLSRLAHHPDAKKYLVCSSKFAADKSTAKGKGRHAFCSRQSDTFNNKNEETGELEVPHSSILWYLLVLAERAWAHANLLQKQKSKRQNVLRKLKKAQGWALKLLEMAKDHTDEVTYEECRAYARWMTANFALEKFDYQKASKAYADAMSLCYHLSQQNTNGESEDAAKELERQDLFVNRADTVLKPLFRYCQYELKQAGLPTMDEPRLNASANSAPANEGEETSIVFRGHELVLESKELRVLLLKYQSMQQDEQQANEEKRDGEASFLNALSVLDDALEVVQGALSTLEQANTGPAVQAKRKQQLLWKGYLQSEKTKRVMEHTQELLTGIDGHAERVHVYDALLQHAQSLLNLPHPNQYTETSTDEEEEDEFALQGQANVLRLRALKTYHMAWYYYEKPRKYEAALAMIQQSKKLCKRAQEEIAACDEDMPHADEYMNELEDLPISSTFAAIQAAMYLQTKHGRNSGGRIETDRPLLLRLQEEDSGTVLAELTPMPMPCKPAFFDLAYGHAMDSTESVEKIQAYVDMHTVKPDIDEAESTASSSGGGIFGWLTGSS
eukprot:scaffold10507_cov128-Cylindrotheca_fusiformis.AAC.2